MLRLISYDKDTRDQILVKSQRVNDRYGVWSIVRK